MSSLLPPLPLRLSSTPLPDGPSPSTHRPRRRATSPATVPIHQALLPLGHGPVHWDTLPPEVRERTLALWRQLLAAHRAHEQAPSDGSAARAGTTGGSPR